MADPNTCLPYNTPGRFYVDSRCTNCQLCTKLAPEYFVSHPIEKKSYVMEQPRTVPELALVREAIRWCPENAIGDRAEYAQYFAHEQKHSAAA